MAYWFILSLSLNEKVYGDWVQLRLWPTQTRAPRTSKVRRSDCRVYSRNWPMRVKWAPFCNFRGAFFKKKRYKKGGTKSKYTSWVLFETFDILHGSDSSDALPPFRNILSNWESLGSNYTAESRMFVWWNDDSKEEEKGNCYSKRL